jgi:uncharacterized integral membrane protein
MMASAHGCFIASDPASLRTVSRNHYLLTLLLVLLLIMLLLVLIMLLINHNKGLVSILENSK